MPDYRASEPARRRVERLFVVRVWREETAEGYPPMRGSVVEVASGARFFFSNLTDLNDFLKLRLSGDG